MKYILLLLWGFSCVNAFEIKHSADLTSNKLGSCLYVNTIPTQVSLSADSISQTARIHNVSLYGVKNSLRKILYKYNDALEEAVHTFNIDELNEQKRVLKAQLSNPSLSCDDRVLHSKQVELLIYHYNSSDVQCLIAIMEADPSEADSAISYLKSRYQMGALSENAMALAEKTYSQRPEVITAQRRELIQAEQAVHKVFCSSKNSLRAVRDTIQKRRQILKNGKYPNGQPLTDAKKRILQKEIELMQQYLRLPGMTSVGIMQKETTTFPQALWESSRLGDCDAIVKDAAQATLESYPEYEAYLQAQQEHTPEVVLDQDGRVVSGDIKPINILDITDLTAGRPLLEHYAQDSPIRTRFLEIYDEVKGNLPVGPNVEHDTMREVWKLIEKEGILDDDTIYFAKRYFNHLAPTNPLEHPREFATNMAKYTAWWAINIAATEGMSGVIQTISAFSQLQDLMSSDFSGMTRREKLDFLAEQSAEITMAFLTSKAFNKLAPRLKPSVTKPSSIDYERNPVAVTPEGVPIEVGPEEMPNTSALKNAAEKEAGDIRIITKVQIFEKNAQHIFRKAPGHLLDTPANRELLIGVASDPANFLITDKYGNQWFAKLTADGKQIWAVLREGYVRYGGLNETPKVCHSETGLSKILPKGKK